MQGAAAYSGTYCKCPALLGIYVVIVKSEVVVVSVIKIVAHVAVADEVLSWSGQGRQFLYLASDSTIGARSSDSNPKRRMDHVKRSPWFCCD